MLRDGLSLRSKMVLVFLVPTLLIVLLYGLMAYFSARQGLEDELAERLVAVGSTLSADLSQGVDAEQIARLDATKGRVLARLREKLVRVRERAGVARIVLFDPNFLTLVDTAESTQFGDPAFVVGADRMEIAQTFSGGRSTTSPLFSGADGQLYKTAYVAVLHEGRPVAALAVEAGADNFSLLTDFARALVLLGGLGLVLMAVVSRWFAGLLTRPLNRLVEATRRLAGPVGPGQEAGPAPGGDEIAYLSRSFEEMRQHIEGRDLQMKMMLSGIAHEVRNPLGGMELMLGLLQEDLDRGGRTEEGRHQGEMVRRIRREVDCLGKVVTEFLDFARQQRPTLERFEASRLAQEIAGLLAGELLARECTLEVEVAPPGLELVADREQLRRALLNVVQNACQACGPGGRIRLLADLVDGELGARRIVVEDNGPGMSAELREKVWTPFFTTREKGSGLGLSLVREIVARHGGEVDVSSAVGEGTQVIFVLPFDAGVVGDERPAPSIPEGWLG